MLGSHMSIAGGVAKSVARGESVGCTAMQIFVKGNTRWQHPPLTDDDAEAFRTQLAKSPIKSVIAHAIYLVNLASGNPDFYRKSIDDLVEELGRCDRLGVSGLVLHPGAPGEDGPDVGIERIAAGLDEVFTRHGPGKCRILLETTAGQGSALGVTFDEIAAIIKRSANPKRLAVCLDTCHVFAAGHDLRTRPGYDAMWLQFDRVLGLRRLAAIHLNDSKKPLGSRRDRHEHIGKGEMGLEPFRFLLNDTRLRAIPMVLETDKGPDLAEDVENLRVLRSLIAP